MNDASCMLSMPLPLLESCPLEYKKESKASRMAPAKQVSKSHYYHIRGEAKFSRQTKVTTLLLCACRGMHCLRLHTIMEEAFFVQRDKRRP